MLIHVQRNPQANANTLRLQFPVPYLKKISISAQQFEIHKFITKSSILNLIPNLIYFLKITKIKEVLLVFAVDL